MSNFYIFKLELSEKILPKIFIKLNVRDINIICNYLIYLFEFISVIMNIKNTDVYIYNLKDNNYKEIRWFIKLLLPNINDKSYIEEIRELYQIFYEKINDVDIDKNEPLYKYSNIQYNLCNRDMINKIYTERDNTYIFLNDNFYFLLDTIKTIANKMFANWINIFPYSLTTYKTSDLYKNTKTLFDSNKLYDWSFINIINNNNYNILNDDLKNNNIKNNIKFNSTTIENDLVSINDLPATNVNSINIQEIYDICHNDLYNNMKINKWLIYDVNIDNIHYSVPFIYVLSYIFDLNEILISSENEYTDLSQEMKIKIKNNYDYFKNNVNNRTVFTNNNAIITELILDSDLLKKIATSITLSFDRTYREIIKDENNKSNKYIPISNNYINEYDDEIDEIYNNKIKYLTFNDIETSFNSINVESLYKHIYETLQEFKTTWYGYNLLTEDKKKIKEFVPIYHKIDINNDIYTNITFDVSEHQITLKHIHDFAKALVHYKEYKSDIKSIYTEMPNKWICLNDKQKNNIIDKLNNKSQEVDNWFNFGEKKLSIIKKYNTNIHKRDIIFNIYYSIRTFFIDTIMTVLITKGILTYFTINPEISKTIFNTTDDNNTWKSSYNFLSRIPYYLDNEFYVKHNDKYTLYNIFTYYDSLRKSNSRPWYSYDSLNWISQIGFCEKFINTRITFITGATGTGKSTQVPKLFLYYSIAIDNNNNAKIACTEPRKNAVESNASFVALQLGLPIQNYKIKNDKIKNDNLETNNSKTDNLKTDNYYVQTKLQKGSHEKVKSHPLLKFIIDASLLLSLSDITLQINSKNIYDVIILDEAHEHKINTDLLLTLLKLPVLLNNSIRLVILSATMDDDEKTYRRYYRDINDNRKYPCSNWLESVNLDRINIDRRYDIAAPNTSTLNKIEEFYTPNIKPFDAILNIINTSFEGHILVFEVGEQMINKLLIDINTSNKIPNDVIALPYYTGMVDKYINSNYSDFIKDININIRYTVLDKKKPDYNNLKSDTIVDIYKRAIIIATNIAEASITIEGLKYVVETGKQKISIYDYKKKDSILETRNISESSRIQRKGRVGRTSNGTVYYLYDKNAMVNNKVIYGISTENLYLYIYKYLQNSNIEIFSLNIDPNNKNNDIKLEQLKIKSYEKKEIKLIDKIKILIRKLYFNVYTYYNYFGNNKSYDYDNYKKYKVYYDGGYDLETLLDNKGDFYIIHPDELYINRNINGDIISISNDTTDLTLINDKLNSKKMESFKMNLEDLLYLENNKKTNLGINICTIAENLKFKNEEHKFARMLFFGNIFNRLKEMIKIYIFYKILDAHNKSNLFDLIENFTEIRDISLKNIKLKEFKTKFDFKKNKSDFDCIIQIVDEYKEIKKKYNKNDELVKLWCVNKYLDKKILDEFDKEYNINKENLMSTFKINKNIYANKIINLSKHSVISICMLLSLQYNMCKKITGTQRYLSVINPSISNTFILPILTPVNEAPSYLTLIDPIYLENYILYLKKDGITDEITNLIYIEPQILPVIHDIFIKTIDYSKEINIQETSTIINKIIEFKKTTEYYNIKKYSKHHTVISRLNNTIKQLELEFYKIKPNNELLFNSDLKKLKI